MNISPRLLLTALLLMATWGRSLCAAEPVKSPLTAADSLAAMELAEGLTIAVAAAEPEVIDPVAVRFDERGRMWVVEMRDYPHGPAAGEMPKSRIRILEDRDHDGVYETAATFADGLLFATGIQLWNGGVFATVAGKVVYLQDTDGDGAADQSEVWYTGFAEENSQLRANHPRLGVDGWIYVANGLRGGTVVGTREGDQPVDLRNADFRFHPRTRDYQAISGPGQFGMCFDDLANRFVCSNRHPLDHVVLGRRYQAVNPLAPAFAPLEEVAAAAEASKIFPISNAWTTSNLHAGQFTAACGIMIHRGDALPAKYQGAAFTCDPTGNLVHASAIEPGGATFTAAPLFANREFLASRDTWFRPVNLENGADGAMYIVDMYRAVIEHPQFMPDELKERPDLLLGTDRGRIYRVAAGDRQAVPLVPIAADTATVDLIALLSHANLWQRETSLRMLHEKGIGEEAAALLASVAGSNQSATARIAALHLLNSHGRLSDAALSTALSGEAATYEQAAVVRQAILLAETRLASNASLRELAEQRLTSPMPVIAFQAALSLATVADFDRARLAPLYREHADDIWLQRALAIAAGNQSGVLTNRLLSATAWDAAAASPSARQRFTLAELTRMAALDPQGNELLAVLMAFNQVPREARYLPLRFEIATSAAAGLQRRGGALSLFKRHADAAIRDPVVNVLADAARVAVDLEAPQPLRVAAIELLGYDLDEMRLLEKLALAEGTPEIRAAAVTAIAGQAAIEPWQRLLAEFPRIPPVIRLAVLEGVWQNPERIGLLLDAVDAGVISLGEIDPLRMQKLKASRDPDIRNRLQALLDDLYPQERKEAIAAHRQALGVKGDPLNGREVFKKNCAACHKIAGIGQQIGPDISDSRIKTPEQLLTDILEPNIAIDANYIGFTVQTTGGKVFSGIVEAATDDKVTLRIPENNASISFSSDEIEQMISTGASLMPEGFEKNISLQEMADLISFIKNWRYLDGSVPLGEAQ